MSLEPQKRVAYIAHEIGNDVRGNIKLILAIAREINLTEPDVIPCIPYLSDVMCLKDSDPIERKRGLANGIHILKSGYITELRLYGPRISSGMVGEIAAVGFTNVRILPMTDATKKEYNDASYLNRR